MTIPIKLTAKAACRVAGIDRDRFNEHVASGAYPCAPNTVPGRSRLFDPDDMLALRLFQDLLDDGYNAKRAGAIACTVGNAARRNPEERVIAYMDPYLGSPSATTYTRLQELGNIDDLFTNGSDVRSVTLYRVGKLRELNAHYTEEERSIVGEDD